MNEVKSAVRLNKDAIKPLPSPIKLRSEEERRPNLFVDLVIDDVARHQGVLAMAAAMRESGGTDSLGLFALALLEHASRSTAQLFQDLFALYFTDFKSAGYFVEVGTGDGHLISNTYLLEKEYGWKGIVVEPNPVFLPALTAQRSCKIATECVLDVTGRSVNFQCTDEPEFSGVSSQQIGFQDADLMHTDRRAGASTINLTTISLNDLLKKYKAPRKIDFMSIDVEGAEFSILRTFAFDRWEVGCLCIEHNWGLLRGDIAELMAENGYVRVYEHLSRWDDWFVHGSVLNGSRQFRELLRPKEERPALLRAQEFLRWSTEATDRGDLEVAMALCARALEIDATLGSAHRTMADLAHRRERPALALRHWRQALAIDPEDFWAHLGLATLLMHRGEHEEAVASVVAAKRLNGDHPVLASLIQQAQASELAAGETPGGIARPVRGRTTRTATD